MDWLETYAPRNACPRKSGGQRPLWSSPGLNIASVMKQAGQLALFSNWY